MAHTPWATTDPEEGRKEEGEEAEEQQCGGGKRSQAGEWTLRLARENGRSGQDCVDVEPEEEEGESREAGDEEEEVKEEEVTGEEKADEKPPGLPRRVGRRDPG